MVIVTGSRTASRGRPRFPDANSAGFESILFLSIRLPPGLRRQALWAEALRAGADLFLPALPAQTRPHPALLPGSLPRRRSAGHFLPLFLQQLQSSAGTGQLGVNDLHRLAAKSGFPKLIHRRKLAGTLVAVNGRGG